ncbi:MAG: hypothetical protein LC116_10740 [Bacteroidetes bacterium]|nr:hypothetical protein [Bacteroidota bacterium]
MSARSKPACGACGLAA